MKKTFLILIGTFIFFGCARKTTVTVYHIGDMRGFYWARQNGGNAPVGGYAVLKNILSQERHPYLLLSAGNWFLGTPEGVYQQGRSSVELMNMVKVDASAIGSMDFYFGEQSLETILKQAKFKVLGANVHKKGTSKNADFVLPYVIREFGDTKVGIFGLTGRYLNTNILRRKLKTIELKEEISTASNAVKELKKQGANFIIALAQMGIGSDKVSSANDCKLLARQVEGIDLIISGGNDTYMQTPLKIGRTLIVQSGTGLRKAGRLELELNAFTGKLAGFNYKLIDLDSSKFKQDATVLNFVNSLRRKTDAVYNKKIAFSEETLSHGDGESDLGSWVCDCLRRWAKVSAVILDSDNLKGEIKQGEITHRNLYEILPYDASVIMVKVKGVDLKQLLEKNLLTPDKMFQVSGLQIYFDPAKNPGEKILEIYIDGKPLREDSIYRIAIADNMLYANEVFYSFEFANTYENMRNKLLWCMRKEKSIKIPAKNRWQKFKEEQKEEQI